MSPRSNEHGNNSSSSRSSVFSHLRAIVSELDFATFQRCVFVWLCAKGFRHIRSLGRVHRRGRRLHGGADFVAVLPPSGLPIAIQIRHWRSPLQRRTVDEFRSHLLCSGISSGLLVTNAPIMASAYQAAAAYPGRPIQLVSVAKLAGSMAALDLGVEGNRIDHAFFRTLQHLRFASISRGADGLPPIRRYTIACRQAPGATTADPVGPSPDDRWIIWLLFGLILLVMWLFGGWR